MFLIFSSFCVLKQILFYTNLRYSSKGLTYTFLADHESNYDQYKITLSSRNYVTFQVKLCNDAYIMLEDTAGVWRVWQPSFNICQVRILLFKIVKFTPYFIAEMMNMNLYCRLC